MNLRFKAFLLSTFLLLFIPSLWADGSNIAPLAKVSASTSLNAHYAPQSVVDGLIGVTDQGEWACEGQGVFWGYIRYPWIQLDWDETQTMNQVILYDRASLEEHTGGGVLTFSDGSEIRVNVIPNDGSPKVLNFAPKKVKWLRFEVTDGDGLNLGLSEIEVFPAPEDYTNLHSWVDPFIETTRGRYFYFTPANRPFGMIAPAPITRNKNQWGGGYNYNSTEILGFGQLHGWMLSGLQIMPTTGSVDPTLGEKHWKSSFSHDGELAVPGYYRVFLKDYKTWVELTSTRRVAFYRLRYTQDAQAQILANLGGYLGSTTMADAQVDKINDREFAGSFMSAGRMWGGPEKVQVFFVVRFDKDFTGFDSWQNGKVRKNSTQLREQSKLTRQDSMTFGNITQSYWNAPSAGVSARYDVKAGEVLNMKIAISYTSVEKARQNLEAECKHWNFEQVQEEAQKEWNGWLGKMTVKGGTQKQKVKFYTDLWHVLLGRHILNDVSGEYPDYTQGKKNWKFTDAKLQVRQLPRDNQGRIKYNMYNSDALWLTQWNLNVLWGLAWPEILDDFSASMVQYADNGGLLPRGPCAGGYSYIMTGNPATNMLVSAYMKGMLTKMDAKHAFEVMKRNHQPGGMMGDSEEELQFYIKKGWAPDNAGKSLEWTFQDWALAQMALKLKKRKDYRHYSQRAQSWMNLFRYGEQLIFPKDKNGEWLHDDPLSGHGWVEANAWQGTWSISHDIAGLARLMGGNDALCEKLNYAFEQAVDDDFVFGYGAGYVSYANQPGCSNAHVFNHAGQPWLSQYWVRQVNEQAYGETTPDQGYGGHDEDQGQMGGVSALMSIGLFSLRGNTAVDPIYEITSPVFDEITISLNPRYYEGKQFVIKTYNNSEENMYIQKAALNGEPLENCWFYHSDFAKGGLLEIWLGPQPNKKWGVKELPGANR